MTDAQFQSWLNSSTAIRIVLIEAMANVDGTETTRYLATGAYNTSASDTPANTNYLPLVTGGISFEEKLSIETTGASLSVGDIEIDNSGGARDSWLSDVWVNRQVQAFIGDPRWVRSDFRMIFNGVAADIDSKNRVTLNIKLRDKLQRLNTPVSDTKLGGTTPNKDAIIPSVFGEVHNVTPLLTNPATLEYQVHGGAVENIFEVRDNGKPVTATVTNSTGKFTLAASPAGAVTASVQGDKPSTYYNTISQLIQRIVTGYGQSVNRFVSGDLDAANLSAFDTAHTQVVGIYLGDRTNVLVACQELANSVGAQISMSRAGLLRLIQVTLPPSGTPTPIGAAQMLEHTIAVVGRTEVVSAVKLGFCKNYTVQAGLQTSIPAQHKDLFATEYITVTSTDSTTQTTYRLNVEPPQQNTLLSTSTDAQAEADRRLLNWKVTRTTYRFEGTASLLTLALGDPVTLTSARFGLSAGKLGMVTSLKPNWLNGRITVEVTI